MSLVVLACKVLQTVMEPYLAQLGIQATFKEYGLHRTPQLMAAELQPELDRFEPATVVIGYGLCGNGLVGLRAGRHKLVIPRADDCIAILLGSYNRYLREFWAEPGTYYLTRGWLESGSNPLAEYLELVARYGQATADWIADEQYHNYTRLVLVAPDHAELAAMRPRAREVAEFCARRWQMRYEERLGSDGLVRRLLIDAPQLADSTDEFIIVPPGGVVQASYFWRGLDESRTRI